RGRSCNTRAGRMSRKSDKLQLVGWASPFDITNHDKLKLAEHCVKIQIVIIHPAKTIRGRIRVPGDKSISHRAAMIGALADGASQITNYSTSADCAATLSCLRQLGVRIDQEADHHLTIRGVGKRGLRRSEERRV